MPTYSYRCVECEHTFDQHQAFTEDSLRVCPACSRPALRKVFNSIGVTFSGSGFYRTDSRAEAGGSKKSTLPAQKAATGERKSAESGSGAGTARGAVAPSPSPSPSASPKPASSPSAS